MPYTKPDGTRDYKRERAREKKNGDKRGKERSLRNQARRKAGLKVGDSRQADHKKPLSEGGSNDKSNIRIVSAKTNAQKEVKRKKKEARAK